MKIIYTLFLIVTDTLLVKIEYPIYSNFLIALYRIIYRDSGSSHKEEPEFVPLMLA